MSGRFWMILRDDGRGREPTRRHDTLSDAQAEARRLVAKEGAAFVVLEAVGIVEPAPRPVRQTMFAEKHPTDWSS